jgi:hypothetical protein
MMTAIDLPAEVTESRMVSETAKQFSDILSRGQSR